ncbi:MAG TPA: SGNH/GDSL hydrolase family protein [Salinimicrobium sp.]|nr:SGNH/GDSL hydrolase family protein [Salinimicrobium sp.]
MNSKFSFLIVFLMLAACSKKITLPDGSKSPSPMENSEKITYLALGDSYTIGESVAERERWPVQLAEALNEMGFKVANPKIIAKTGWTTADLLRAMEQGTGQEKYDLVSVLIGVNNQYQGLSISEYEEDLRVIFEKAINLSSQGKNGVFVLSIPDYGTTPFGASNAEEIGKEIEKFNAVLRMVAEDFDLPFYNITPISKKAKTQPDLVADDGLHPSGKMYRLWVEEIIDEVIVLL